MRTEMRRIPLVLLAALALPACSDAWKPLRVESRTVEGTVHLGPVPVGGGWIEFHPAGRTVGDFTTAILRPDGRFIARSVPVGEHFIKLVTPSFPLPSWLTRPGSLPRFQVSPDRPNFLDFDVAATPPHPFPAVDIRPNARDDASKEQGAIPGAKSEGFLPLR